MYRNQSPLLATHRPHPLTLTHLYTRVHWRVNEAVDNGMSLAVQNVVVLGAMGAGRLGCTDDVCHISITLHLHPEGEVAVKFVHVHHLVPNQLPWAVAA